MMKEKNITIFTPTFNRVYCLENLYRSLCQQSCHDFIWLIVDDGSNDGTCELVNKWQKENIIEIKYVYQQNAGKMQAHNRAVDICETDYIVDIDSDDVAEQGCVVDMIKMIDAMKHDENIAAAAAAYRSQGEMGNLGIFEEINRTTLHGIYQTGFSGETTLLFKTAILKKFPFPKVKNEKFIPEGYIYAQIDNEYCMLTATQHWVHGVYLSDGYTNNSLKLLKENPNSMALLYRQKYEMTGDKKSLIKMMTQHILGDKSLLKEDFKMSYLAIPLFPVACGLAFKRVIQFWRNGLYKKRS